VLTSNIEPDRIHNKEQSRERQFMGNPRAARGTPTTGELEIDGFRVAVVR
jgi:hypothetical protein